MLETSRVGELDKLNESSGFSAAARLAPDAQTRSEAVRLVPDVINARSS